MKITLTLVRSDRAPAAAAAWLIPCADPAVWIQEIARWRVSADALAIFVLPESLRSRRPTAALVVSKNESILPHAVQRAVPYACRASRIFMPVDAEIFPPVSDDELQKMIAWPVAVFHPAAGLVGFSEADALRITDLLAAPSPYPIQWIESPPAPARPRLKSIELLEPPTLLIAINGGKGDIGSKAPENAPPGNNEPQDGLLDKSARNAMMPIAKGVNWLSKTSLGKMIGQSAAGKSLGSWAEKMVNRINAEDMFLRNKELNRLINRMQNDPDDALKYAIPLTGDNRWRGTAPSSNMLGPRDIGFDLSRLFGGGGAGGSAWYVDAQMHQRLREQYLDAANRELRLKRYRRAAYIFAELLGDFVAAASALRQGRFFREAAVIYREKSRPMDAAECLAEGGLLLEAIPIFVELEAWMKAAELYEKLDRPEEARPLFMKEVTRLTNIGAMLEAAQLLEHRVHDPDAALALLESTWPHGVQAALCLTERLALLDRHQRHDQLRQTIANLRNDPAQKSATIVPLVQSLVEGSLHTSRPDLRKLMGETARVVAGRRLRMASIAQASQMLTALRKLDEKDRLFARDIERFLRPASSLIARSKNAVPQGVFRKLSIPVADPKQRKVPSMIVSVDSDPSALWAARLQGNRLDVLTIDWASEKSRHVGFDLNNPGRLAPAHMLMMPGKTFITFEGKHSRIPMLDMPGIRSGEKRTAVGEPPNLPDQILGWCSLGMMLWVLSRDESGDMVMTSQWPDGSIIHRMPLDFLKHIDNPIDDQQSWFPMLAIPGCVLLGVGSTIFRISHKNTISHFSAQSRVRSLHNTLPGGPDRPIACLEDGGVYLQARNQDSFDGAPFGHDMSNPMMEFTSDGSLIAVTPTQGRIYVVGDTGATIARNFDPPTQAPTAVLRGPRADTFAIVDNDATAFLMRTGAA